MREVSAWVRSSVVAVLSRLELVVRDTIRELGSLVSIKVIGFWSGRGQMAAFIIRGKMISVITMGSNVRTAAWGPDLEDSMEMENEHSILQGNKDLQISKISLQIHNQKKSRMNEQKIEVSHLNGVRMLYPVFRPEPGLRPRIHQLKGKPMSPCKDVRAGARRRPAGSGPAGGGWPSRALASWGQVIDHIQRAPASK